MGKFLNSVVANRRLGEVREEGSFNVFSCIRQVMSDSSTAYGSLLLPKPVFTFRKACLADESNIYLSSCLSVCMNPVNGQAVGPILTKFGMGA